MVQSGNDFNAVRIALASPEQIKTWSYGEVVKPETINYRTLRPEKDGLFCERIFGPTKDWECYCGKYKKIRYKGVICDRCGVEVARAKVRRERMGHISLAAPVSHIWMSKGTPSRLGLLLDLSPRNLERVVYFAQYMVTSVDEGLRKIAIQRLERSGINEKTSVINSDLDGVEPIIEQSDSDPSSNEIVDDLEIEHETVDTSGKEENILDESPSMSSDDGDTEQPEVIPETNDIDPDIQAQIDDLTNLYVGQLLSESRYRDLMDSCGEVFTAGMGAEAIRTVLTELDLSGLRDRLQDEIRKTSGQRRKKAIKTLRVVEAFRKSGNKPEWMVLPILPVLPPELRPMVQLDGGRFATSDLNDLYRRVINRNNRLKRLIELQAPEIIVRNEKRMLQEGVDALIDNGRRGRPVAGSHNHKLKSLSDLLRGKQGRFRQNLLGKRVDYSGRSVITVGPGLKLHQCGLPRRMALELFKPFVMNRLVLKGYAHNIKSAKRLAERAHPEVWDILEDVTKNRPVLLNRAPTLHRLGIQAFQPILVEGGSIQVHPLVCAAFNADFDGDQMAVHVPLSRGAVQEANKVMLSTYNMLSPSSGEPIVAPTLDIAFGCYYMTMIEDGVEGTGKTFADFQDARLAYDVGIIDLRALINVRYKSDDGELKRMDTTVGRIIFNDVLPEALRFRNAEQDKAALKEITGECHRVLGSEETLKVLDAIKDLGFQFASKSGTTIAINDIEVSDEKQSIVSGAEQQIQRLDNQYMDGLITEDERYINSVQVWTDANDHLTGVIDANLHKYGGIYLMAVSGAKGNIAQIKQMAGMRGLMSDPKGRIIARPIKSSFREGLSVLEYFISTHGARKGLADTALRTADSGYLTRRLIDVAQEVTIANDDCETLAGIWVENSPDMPLMSSFAERLKSRFVVSPVADPSTGEIIIDVDTPIDENIIDRIEHVQLDGMLLRSPLTCEASRGICRKCYGISLATWDDPLMGEAVGIIAAQSIGEPGTQLTMRTFHTGGIAGLDITSGLPRVEELFEARSPKGEAVLSEIDGIVEVTEVLDGRSITVMSSEQYSDQYVLDKHSTLTVADGDIVSIGDRLVELKDDLDEESLTVEAIDSIARAAGIVQIEGDLLNITWSEDEHREYIIPAASHITVKDGERVTAGQALTSGPKSPQQILRIQGREKVQNYLIEEVQKVYRSQGVSIHDKHIEVVIRQMLQKVRIDAPGDTDLLPGELVNRYAYEEINSAILAEGGEPATASPVLLGITRASLNMESFLAAASFQETTRVLTDSSVNGEIDYLRGLKENVIIGRLIPARYDSSDKGRERLGLDQDPPDAPVKGLMGDMVNSDDLAAQLEDTPEEIPTL